MPPVPDKQSRLRWFVLALIGVARVRPLTHASAWRARARHAAASRQETIGP
jgi:hypothetical protein